jgi:hypothetical protein
MFKSASKTIDKGQLIRGLPTCIGTIAGFVGLIRWANDGGSYILPLLCLIFNIAYWIFDLVTLGKQVDRWNEKHAGVSHDD